MNTTTFIIADKRLAQMAHNLHIKLTAVKNDEGTITHWQADANQGAAVAEGPTEAKAIEAVEQKFRENVLKNGQGIR